MREFYPADGADFPLDHGPPAALEFSIAGERYEIPLAGSVIKRYSKGEGCYDHFIHYDDDGFLVLLPGDQEGQAAFDRLEEQGVRVESLHEPDEQTISIIVETEVSAMISSLGEED